MMSGIEMDQNKWFDFHERFRQPELLPQQERRAFTVRIDLAHTNPPIWRRLRVASDTSLQEMHHIIQGAMGWLEPHLHQFLMGPGARDWDVAPFLTDFSEAEGEPGIHESFVRLDNVLAESGDRLHYEYDFGDGWQHTIKLESVSGWDVNDPLALCLAGRRACPPEDIGGPWGYAEVVDALNGQIKPEHAEFMKEKLAWLPTDFDPEWFSVDEVNQMLDQPPPSEVLDGWDPHIGMLLTRLFGPVGHTAEQLVRDALVVAGPLERNVAAASVHRFQVLIEAVGDGVRLTQAGWLPPALVRDIAERLELGDQWIRPANREDQTFPVAQLRQAAMDVGLLRKSKGVLSVPARVRKMIDSPEKLLDHIAERMPVGRRADQQDGGLVVLLAAAAGRSSDLSSRNLGAIFWASGWQTDDDPDLAFHESAKPTLSVLSQLAGGHLKRVPVSVARRMLREDGV